MVPIKIQCGCGQRYQFDVEPANGRVPSPVACPACGADGTDAANAFLAQTVTAAPPAPVLRGRESGPLRIAAAAHKDPPATPASPWTAAQRRVPLQPGQIDRTQAKYEAHAKILWGDPPKEVIIFLLSHGFSREDAVSIVEEMFRERQATIRRKGIMNIFCGIALICVPVAAFVYFLFVGYILV